jgi:hypothetical protein
MTKHVLDIVICILFKFQNIIAFDYKLEKEEYIKLVFFILILLIFLTLFLYQFIYTNIQ